MNARGLATEQKTTAAIRKKTIKFLNGLEKIIISLYKLELLYILNIYYIKINKYS